MTKLTKRTVDAAKPEGRDHFLWDDDLPGFGLRVFASGRKSWLIQYRLGRTPRRFTIGPHDAFIPDEARNLRWDYGDLQRGALLLPDSKTGAKAIPLSSAAIRVLSELPRRSEWVLPSTRTEGPIIGLQNAWEMVRVWCGFEDARIHDLHHSFATYAVTEGASLYLVGKVLGHKKTRTTECYAHVANNPVKAFWLTKRRNG